jgi:DNA-binding NarL/FixJ family response regulator
VGGSGVIANITEAGKPKVLVAEDHPKVAQHIKTILDECCHLVGTVRNGRELLTAVKQHDPDVIVADISMPELTGLDALRLLRSQGERAKVIILTVHSEPRLARAAFEAGASAYVLKYRAGEELLDALHAVIRGRVYLTPRMDKELTTIRRQTRKQPPQSLKSID